MYELRGYGVEDFIAACVTLKEKHPEMYEKFYSIIRSQPIHISKEDMEYVSREPFNKIIPLIPNIVIEETCGHCGFYHPGGTCLDS